MTHAFKRGTFIGLAMITAIVAADLLGSTAYAQSPRQREREERLAHRECKPESIEGIGAARPTFSWARSSAISRWRNEVIARFGKEFAEFDDARDVSPRCFHTETGYLKQCAVRAVPCRVPSF
jgi:hypothetical protein